MKFERNVLKNIGSKRKITFAVLFVFFIGIIWGSVGNGVFNDNQDAAARLITDWSYENAEGNIVELKNSNSIQWNKGEPLVLEKTLDEDSRWENREVSIGFYSIYQSVKVQKDNSFIYEKNENNTKCVGKAVPSGWNYVNLGEYKSGSVIKITLESVYEMSAGNIPDFYIGTGEGIVRMTYDHSLINFILDVLIFFLGAFWIVQYFYTKKISQALDNSYSMAVFALNFSLWLHCGAGYRPATFFSDAFTCYIAQITFLIIPVSYSYMMSRLLDSKIKKVFEIVLYVSAGNLILNVFLQNFKVVDIVDIIYLTHVIIIVMLIITVISFADRMRMHEIEKFSSKTVGTICLIAATVLEFFSSYYLKLERSGMIIRIGVIIYVASMELGMMKKSRKNEIMLQENKMRLQEVKVKLLLRQIQPHFIYNTLGSIQGLIKVSPREASDLVYKFSKYLRENIDSIDGPERIPMEQELRHIQSYMEIEKIRFDERVNFLYDISDDNFYITPLSIQPLVENAVKHGICKKDEGGYVSLKCYEKEKYGCIVVEDNGVGFNVDEVMNSDKQSVGLKNSIYRLETTMGAKVSVESEIGVGTKISIKFPADSNRVYDHPGGRAISNLNDNVKERRRANENNPGRRREDHASSVGDGVKR